ncbi:MAG TPA: hypothetical protein VGM84_13000 [Steroidobacteraceae bacterium]
MTSRLARLITSILLTCCVISRPVHAQYEVERDSRIWLRALLDVRLVGGGPAPSWTDRGPGKLRYGGSPADSGFERATRLVLSQAALQIGAQLPWDVRAQTQFNIEPDVAGNYRPWLIEALLRKEWGEANRGWGLQSGVMNVPFSLENTGPAWTPAYTISASALNSWLWEDMSLAGAEGEGWYVTSSGIRLGALVGAGYGGDQIGRILALRGWVMGDTLAGINGDLALPGRDDRTSIFNDRDHRPGVYSWLSVGDAGEIVSARLGIMDNRGDEGSPGVWHTHFTTVGIVLHPLPRIDVLAQYLDGAARVRSPANDSALSAAYVLVSYHTLRQRLSLRYDSFRIHDLDGGPNTNEHGHALTTSYFVDLGLRSRVALEYIRMDSQREATGLVNPTPDGWQVSYRFRY